ncbi:AAA family ATPase [Moorella naiadis]|uniref:AAA family ATPase n=1 Tax=Moorella naiadis (nom. illeg.) TaxID=3093670 RepID=UPI003D9CB398
MRIAITGAHGVGKSTLALLLATELQLPLIEEIARVAAEKMGYTNTRDIIAAGLIDKQRFQETILSCQINTEFRYYANGFVADRSVLDVAAYAAWYKLPEARDMRKNAVEYARRNYDLIFYIPLSDMPAEDDGFRLTDRKSQEQIDALIGKMTGKLNNVVKISSRTPGERLGEALTWVGTLRRLRAIRPGEMINDVAILDQYV